MKPLLLCLCVFAVSGACAQDSTAPARPIEIFSSERAINANTNETVGRGKMAFKVTHLFGDIAGKNGGIKKFFGLDGATDVRIAFEVGLGENFDLIASRAKGGSLVQQLYELGMKWQFLRQMPEGKGSPLAAALFANTVVIAQPENPLPAQENSYRDFGDRLNLALQLILARRFGQVSLALLPTWVTRGYTLPYDSRDYFALGGIIRVPLVSGKLNMLVDYFHTFRREDVKRAFYEQKNRRFYDPLGVGFEYMTTGHVFRFNFTNTTESLPNRYIPHTVTSWSKGQYRWGFTIVRKFSLWR